MTHETDRSKLVATRRRASDAHGARVVHEGARDLVCRLPNEMSRFVSRRNVILGQGIVIVPACSPTSRLSNRACVMPQSVLSSVPSAIAWAAEIDVCAPRLSTLIVLG